MPSEHPLADKASLALADCVTYPFVAPSQEWLRHSVFKLFEARDLQLRVVAKVERIGMLKNLVKAGLGVAFMSGIGFERDVREGRFA